MKRLCSILAFAIVLTGCATPPQADDPAANRSSSDGVVVDYDGVPCLNQNMHVKLPLCLFPRTESSFN
jgi:PBP1b-binding outer membrane lipoprotein LpoB